MAYNTKSLIVDAYNRIVAQYFNPITDKYEALEGADGATNVQLKGSLNQFQTGAVGVVSSAVELTAGLAGRNKLIVYPPTAGIVYWGTSSVTAANGAPLAAGDLPVEFSFADVTLKVFAVSDGTNRTVRVVESI